MRVIDADAYRFLETLLRSHSGLALGPGKEYLLESRLPAVARTFGFRSLAELVSTLRLRPHAQLVKAVCDAMTTGETLFFRDGTPFELLRHHLLPERASRTRASGVPLRIWCAAASTGQEPFSVAMLLAELEDAGTLAGVRVELIATDYASHALNRARRGVFSAIEVQRGLPDNLLARFFTPVPGGYRIAESLRSRVTFRELNLLEPFATLGQFDVVLCRNVLIYFDAATKREVLDRVAGALAPGGYLLLGATESAFGITERLVRVPGFASAVHVRREDAGEALRRAPSGVRPERVP